MSSLTASASSASAVATSGKPKASRGLWARARHKTLKKKGKRASSEGEDGLGLSKTDAGILLSRMRVILAHVEGNAESQDMQFLSSGGLAPDCQEAAHTLVEALAADDTLFLVKTLQRYSCATVRVE